MTAIATTPEGKGVTSRFLYRGALSLPDSFLMLDGLTFTAHLDPSDNSASKSKLESNLLQNPLALALQSMRGRPNLRLLGTLKLKDVYWDDTGGVVMFVVLFSVNFRMQDADCIIGISILWPSSQEYTSRISFACCRFQRPRVVLRGRKLA